MLEAYKLARILSRQFFFFSSPFWPFKNGWTRPNLPPGTAAAWRKLLSYTGSCYRCRKRVKWGVEKSRGTRLLNSDTRTTAGRSNMVSFKVDSTIGIGCHPEPSGIQWRPVERTHIWTHHLISGFAAWRFGAIARWRGGEVRGRHLRGAPSSDQGLGSMGWCKVTPSP